MAEFFVGTILGHYVTVLCESATANADKMLSAEAAATQAQLRAMLLEVGGCVSAATAFCSKRLSTQIVAGLASAAAFGAASVHNHEAELLTLTASGCAPRFAPGAFTRPADHPRVRPESCGQSASAMMRCSPPSGVSQPLTGHILDVHLQGLATAVLPVVEKYKRRRDQRAFDDTLGYRLGFLGFVEATMPGVETTDPYRLLQSPADYLDPRLPKANEKHRVVSSLPSAWKFPGGSPAWNAEVKLRKDAIEKQN